MNADLLYIEFQVMCILLAAVLLKFGMHSSDKGMKYVSAIGWSAMLASFADALRVAFVGNAIVMYICCIVYFCAVGLVGYLWLRYCTKQFGIKSRALDLLSAVPALAVLVIAVMSVWNGMLYSVDEQGSFCLGDLYYMTMVNYLYVVFALIVAGYAARKTPNKREGRDYIATAMCALPVILSAVQTIVLPDGLFTITHTVLLSVLILQSNLQHRQMVTDNLTRLPNRYGMDDEIEAQLQQYKKDKNDSFYIIVCDMDNFKTINDTWGHPEGDRALMLIADALSSVAQRYDAEVFRIGGDEFVIITNTSESGLADLVCADLKTELDNIDFRDDFDIRMSMGVSLYDGSCTISELISGADKKLYQAKKFKNNN